MFGNLTAVAAIIAVFWIAGFTFYLYTSRQQVNIAQEIDDLEKKLDETSNG
ncbi:MAG: hypothetical protein GY796_26185 [Chloroflexi bacterium]|nr:hypothetical protein [Chloroflexota bacterium]